MKRMTLIRYRPLTSLAVVTAAFLLIVGVWSASASHSSKPKLQKQVTVRNQTHALQVTKAELDGKQIRITVKNVSNKNIDWFRLLLGASSSIEADFAFADRFALAPGEIYEDAYPFDSIGDEVRVTVLSVVFENKTTDGDLHYAQRLKDKRSAQKLELNRLLPKLQKAMSASDDNHAFGLLRHFELELMALQELTDESASEATRIGAMNARDRLLNELRRIQSLREQDSKRDIRRDVKLVKERYEAITARLD